MHLFPSLQSKNRTEQRTKIKKNKDLKSCTSLISVANIEHREEKIRGGRKWRKEKGERTVLKTFTFNTKIFIFSLDVL